MARKGWADWELEIIKRYYPTEGIGVKKRLPHRSENQIYGVAWHYGIKNSSRKKRNANKYPRRKYTDSELRYIKRHIQEDGAEAVAEHLQRTPCAIRSIVSKMDLLKDSSPGQLPWTREEIAIMKEYFPVEGIQVRKRLENRTDAAIYSEASHLGIAKNKRTKKSSNSAWTKEEDDTIRKHYEKDGLAKCKELLPDRSTQAIIMRANRYLGIRRRQNPDDS